MVGLPSGLLEGFTHHLYYSANNHNGLKRGDDSAQINVHIY